jgi:hypothetical protein
MNHHERFEKASNINIHTVDMETWAREVRAQMMSALNKKNAQRETK